MSRSHRNWATLSQAYPHPFQTDLAAFINLTAEDEDKSAAQANADTNITEVETATDPGTDYDIRQNPDPLITAPLYGRWHALTKRLLKDADGNDVTPNDRWVHELNLDPRWRTAAGFGTSVVQDNQEDYMAAAWEQVGDVLESNKKIKFAQLAKHASFHWYLDYFKATNEKRPDTWLAVSAPLHARVMTAAVTNTSGGHDIAADDGAREHREEACRWPRSRQGSVSKHPLRADRSQGGCPLPIPLRQPTSCRG